MLSWPQRVRRSPRLATPVARSAAIGILLVALVAVPFTLNNYYVGLLTEICVFAMLGLGLNIVVGYAGLLDLGYAAFFAIGAYATAYLMTTPTIAVWHWSVTFPVPSFWLMLPIGAGLAGIFGVLIGAPTLRLRSDYLAIVTLGFGEITRISATNLDFTGGPNGLYGVPQPVLFGFTFQIPLHYYYLILALL